MKKLIARLCHRTGFWKLAYKFASREKGKKLLAVFTYHRVTDHNRLNNLYLDYDRGIDYRLFRTQIELIDTYFDIVDLDTFYKIASGELEPSEHTALITFDDADSDFIHYPFPILKKRKIPAVVFTPTAYVESERRFWHLRLSNFFAKVTPEIWEKLTEDSDLPEELKSVISGSRIDNDEEKARAANRLVNLIDRYDQQKKEQLMDTFENFTSSEYTIGIKCLTWQEQKELSDNGIRFESHTVNHRKLAELDTEAIKLELSVSKKELESRLGSSVISICYPAGSYNREVCELAPKAGYKLGFVTRPGLVRYPLRDKERFAIRRLTIYGNNAEEIDLYLGKLALKTILKRPV